VSKAINGQSQWRWSVGMGYGAVVLTGLLLAGCPSANNTPNQPSPFVLVSIENSAFMPREVTIQVGQTVRWTNDDPVIHTVTSGNPEDADAGAQFDSHDLIPFDSFTFQFNTVGEFVYFSKWDQGRPGMVGAKVIVTE
jgi:plastocyanin